jgi:hypothetical protein
MLSKEVAVSLDFSQRGTAASQRFCYEQQDYEQEEKRACECVGESEEIQKTSDPRKLPGNHKNYKRKREYE